MIKNYWEYIKEDIDWDDDDLDYEEEEDVDEFITDDEFRKFLIDHDCLKEFAKNVHDKDDRTRGNVLYLFTNNFDMYKKTGRNYINAIIWDQTPEGRDYWAKLDREWMDIVNREKIKKARIEAEKRAKAKAEELRVKKEKLKAKKEELKKNLVSIKKGTGKDFIPDDDFRQFLIDHKCYEEYIKNCYTRGKNDFVEKINKIPKRLWISGAFNWGVKAEYWGKINLDWLKIIEEIRKKENEDRKKGIGGMYDDFITDDKFREFLIENECYNEYIENCLEPKMVHNKNFVEQFDKYSPRWIEYAFVWNRTPENYNYWNRINGRWYDYLKKKNENKN